MFNPSGKFSTLKFSDGTQQTTAGGGASFSTTTGSATSAQMPADPNFTGTLTSDNVKLTTLILQGTTTAITGTSGSGRFYSLESLVTGTPVAGTFTTTSLVAYYKLEDTSDSYGTYTLTNYGTATFVEGKFNNSVLLNGTTQYLQTSVLSTQVTNISVFSWVYINSTSESGAFFNNGVDGVDTNGYALGVGAGSTFTTPGNKLVAHIHGVDWNNYDTLIGTGWHLVGFTRGATTWKAYIDSVQCSPTYTTNPITPSGNFTIGRSYAGGNIYFNNKIDNVIFFNRELSASDIVTLYNETSYLKQNLQYIPPGTTTSALQIVSNGSATTDTYMLANVRTTVWGLGTITSVTGTGSGAYAGWSDRPIRVTGVDIGSSQKIKENVKPIKIKPDLLDAEGMAKLSYIANNKIAWITANGVNYTTVVNKTGTGSVTVVDLPAMESDYNNYIELKWASDPNRDTYTENVQKTYEKSFWQMFDSVTPRSWNPIGNPSMRRKGFVVEEMPDVVWGEDKQSVDMYALIAYMTVAQKALKLDTIFALSTLTELLTTGTVTQQKIDYCNDRLEVLNP